MRKIDPKAFPLYTAVVTPFDANGNVAYPELEKLLRLQERAHNGVVVLGSTGEGLALKEEERREVARFSAGLGLNVPVLVGVPGAQLENTLDFLKFAETLALDGYLMPVPLYAKPGAEGQYEWFRSLLEAVSKPAMLYNVPSRTGVKLNPSTLGRLSSHPNAWALKEASGSAKEFSEFRAAAPSLACYCGDDGLMTEFANAGAVGLVSVASNVWPEATNRYVRLAVSGKHEGLQPLWAEASNSLFIASNPVPVKALLAERGLISTAKVRAPLSLNDLRDRSPILAADRAIQHWHGSN